MTRTWVLLIGAALLWVCACAGADEYTEPAPGDGDVPPEVTDPGSEGGGEGTDPVLISGNESGDPTQDGENGVVDTEGDGNGDGVDPGDGEIITVTSEGGHDVFNTALDRRQVILTVLGDRNVDPSMPEALTVFADHVGLPEGFGLPVSGGLNLITAPEVAQVQSGVGLVMAGQLAALGNLAPSLPDFLAGLDSSPSQIPTGIAAAFAASRLPGIAGLLGNE